MPEYYHFTVKEEEAGLRLDKYLSQQGIGVTRSLAEKYIGQGCVTSNGKTLSKSFRVAAGEEVQAVIPDPQVLDVKPEAIPLHIVYEDNDLLVVNKPKGMVVHPAPGHYTGTLVNALLAYCGDTLSGINGVIRPGIVHRIDKDTSGLLIVAKNDEAHKGLAEQIKVHSFTRIYEAVVHGVLNQDSDTVDAPIGRSPADRKKMAVVPDGRQAVTHYRVLARYRGFTHVRLKLETGRTHQIRVHMAYIGHPVAGDPVYGPKKAVAGLQGQCLHARVIGFVHPRTGKYMEFTSPLPTYFTDFLKRLRP
ncbi:MULTISPECIES: RluA family pseudouridine synthase [Caproicibacterium]|jgi:23S rRNA pseudouridine1911/1915/1917 synthase|uniref:Pseudouridine synthase n=1 Tax=Caproicibacterium lactatifermentans TaxID=2666138 RepID=A0A859DQY1_9FIRM|nr:RluA family pseudouridine synthase [Caproicibacterium lactatifermentans]ARP50181.1 RNA pseudouridine synthase [Ruminococcaceae bacterium CPB6]MDD4808270.1 RluA family pseudouridine synthase [Oscillospiraceae bacterium]QKN24096.1 RluA family pseudouridine synthase [Caproicibacterium lactatifermentans]QKO30836.1 RluA family pseudouridine synthase [Caproicibacterium lactatifermentans]